MRIRVKLFASLRRYSVAADGTHLEIDLPSGSTLGDIINHLGVPPEEVRITFVNGRARSEDWKVEADDEIGIFPPIGGG